VLVVDDNADYAATLAEVIVELGHEVRVAPDAGEALRIARSYRPDLVLLDIGLPGVDGYELGRRLRAEPTTAKTTLVAVTGYGQVTDRAKSAEAGLDLHVVKPIDLAVLEDLIAANQGAPRDTEPIGAATRRRI
jgi:CheY-like chemotaxis protein